MNAVKQNNIDDFLNVFNINIDQTPNNEVIKTVHFENINAFDTDDIKNSIEKNPSVDTNNYLSTKFNLPRDMVEKKFLSLHKHYIGNNKIIK